MASHSGDITPKPARLSIATLNIKFDGDRDQPVPIPPRGTIPPTKRSPWADKYRQLPWPERRSRMVDALLSTGDLDIIGFQEVYHNQLLDLQDLLGPNCSHVGVGRDDGREAGEYSPIFYDNTRFELVKWNTIWLSLTPDRPSKSWDANLPRIATFLTLKLRNKAEGSLLHVVNTHYDDAGRKARAESSLLIREYARRWVEDKAFEEDADASFILMGDFNSPPNEDAYHIITSPDPLPTRAPSLSFFDTFTNLALRNHHSSSPVPRQSAPYGPLHTYTGFAAPGKERDAKRIDFVMLAVAETPGQVEGEQIGVRVGRGGWSAVRYACVDNWIEEGDVDGWVGRWSDHRAVRVILERA